MESQTTPQRAWYFFTDDLPDEEVIMPFRTPYGLAFGVRGGISAEEMLDALNQTADFVLGVGLAQIGHTEKPPDVREE